MNDIRSFLEGIRNGSISVDDAVLELKKKPFEDLGFAKVDIHRKIRQGAAEVIYGSGKTEAERTEYNTDHEAWKGSCWYSVGKT